MQGTHRARSATDNAIDDLPSHLLLTPSALLPRHMAAATVPDAGGRGVGRLRRISRLSATNDKKP